MSGYKNTEEFVAQGGSGIYKLTEDFEDVAYSKKYVRDINFTPSDRRLPDLAICRIYSSREDAGKILHALQNPKI